MLIVVVIFKKNAAKLQKYLHISKKKCNFARFFCGKARLSSRQSTRRRTALTFNKRISMYAIVEMKGQQFRVEAGKKLFINRMNELEKGATVEFENVLLLDNEGKVKVGAPYVKGAKVVCEVLDNECRGDKVLVFHKKRRKGYRKMNGHRQDLTNVIVKEIVIA